MAEKMPAVQLEDDAKERISLMIEHRLPWLLVGMIGGVLLTIFLSSFERLLERNIQLTFFMPIIVYMADAVGTQTESVFVRNLGREKVRLSLYLFKEFLLGLVLGAVFGGGIGIFAYLWFQSQDTALVVGLAMFATIAVAPVVALLIPAVIQRKHTDPALGTGPFATVIQDALSLLIYFAVAGVVMYS